MKNKIIILLISIQMLFSTGLHIDKAQSEFNLQKLMQSEANQVFDSVIENNYSSRSEHENNGYKPAIYDRRSSIVNKLAKHKAKASSTSSFPAYYNLKDKGYVTSVKDQGDYGTCWAFSSISAAEGSLIKNGYATKPDLSEWQLAYFAYEEESSLINFDSIEYDLFDNGGNIFMSTAMFIRQLSPDYEANAPYGVGIPKLSSRPAYSIQDCLSGSTPEEWKQLIMEKGQLDVSFHYDDFYLNDNGAYYCPDSKLFNHEVVIVGWDDNYSASKFIDNPGANGAWIIKNSWGTENGDNGYLYISYEDMTIDSYAYALDFKGYNAQEKIYQYDPLGVTSFFGYDNSDTGWMKNVFTATRDEILADVGLYTYDSNTSYELKVNVENSGNMEQVTTQTGILEFGWYNKIHIKNPIDLREGQKYEIIVKLSTPNTDTPIPLEGYERNYSSEATASAGQSFVSSDGIEWEDISKDGDNVCLQAYTFTESSSGIKNIVSDVDMLPSFQSSIYNYKVNLSEFTSSATFNFSLSDTAQAVIDGKNVTSYTANLNNGETKIIKLLVKKSGSAEAYYTIVITREKSHDDTLSSIGYSAGRLSPSFNKDIEDYTLTLNYNDSQVTVTPKASNNQAKIAINTANVSSRTISLSNGQSAELMITITPQIGEIKYYYITIKRPLSDTSSLKSLSITDSTITSVFKNNVYSYKAYVKPSVSKVYLTSLATDSKSTIYINGVKASKISISLIPSQTKKIIVNVVSQSKLKKTIYTINVTRLKSLNKPTALKPALSSSSFKPTGKNYVKISTKITAPSSIPCIVKAYVFNSWGKYVALINKVDVKSGTYTFNWDGKVTTNNAGLKAGSIVPITTKGTYYTIKIYVYNLVGGNYSSTSTIKLIK